jgi:GTPase SAR1 family protein
MSNASRMRIICDPFKKEIEYQWYDFNIEDYVELDPENSKLASEEFINATIQNRAYEIVGIINRECNVGNVGLEIIFIGTQDDYDDFCKVIDTYYGNANIICTRDEHYFNSATEVMPQIKEKFSGIKSTLEEYTEDEIAKLIYKYNDAVKPSISLCIMGLYSAGKSAFINSIIGEEILPSDSDPTTAKVCKIYCDSVYQIKFWFDNKECVLTFKGKKYKPNCNFDKEIIKNLQSIVDNGEQHDEIHHMNGALNIINNYKNDRHEISDIIEIRVPYKRTSLPVDEFDFIIYDTPGSNSKNNVRHFEVLRDSLDEQTNALPIFMTTPDTMDAEDNDKILKLIEETGTALDTTNAIVVVNKADEKGPKALKEKREKCKELSITKWMSTRIFFVSSVIGIASKKNNPDVDEEWFDEDMYELYDEKKSKYSSDERRLFEFNIVDKSKTDEIMDYVDDKLSTHLYKNCGLESVEHEIEEYARKYALYNKCQQASSYLQSAIDICVENVQENECKLDIALGEAKGHFDEKKAELCRKLDNKKNDITAYNTEFQKEMERDFSAYTKEKNLLEDDSDSSRVLQTELLDAWKKYREEEKKDKEKKEGWALSKIQMYASDKYNDLIKDFSEIANKHIVSFWDEKSKLFKNECQRIVHDSSALTDEQKKILESIVLSKDNMAMYRLDFNLRKIGAIRHKRFLFWRLQSEKFDNRLCREQLVMKFNNEVRKRITASVNTNEKNFRKWADSLISMLIEELCKFNSDLNSFGQKIDELKKSIDAKKDCELMLVGSKDFIDGLFVIQGGDVDDGLL